MNSFDHIKIDYNDNAMWIMNVLLAFIMFGVALDLKVAHFKALFREPRALFVGVSSQFILLPFLTFILVYLLQPAPSIALGMILVAACPGGNISNFLTHWAQGNSALSISMTAFATFACFVLTPFNLSFWGSLYPPSASILREASVNPFELLELILLILGIPLVIGMWIGHQWPNIAEKLVAYIRPLSFIIFVVFILGAVWQNRAHFSYELWYIFAIVMLHNLIAMLSGWGWAKLWGLDFANQKAVIIETSIQNSGLGLAIIFTFFEGLGGMALIAAAWGMYHIVAGLSVSSIFRYRAALASSKMATQRIRK